MYRALLVFFIASSGVLSPAYGATIPILNSDFELGSSAANKLETDKNSLANTDWTYSQYTAGLCSCTAASTGGIAPYGTKMAWVGASGVIAQNNPAGTPYATLQAGNYYVLNVQVGHGSGSLPYNPGNVPGKNGTLGQNTYAMGLQWYDTTTSTWRDLGTLFTGTAPTNVGWQTVSFTVNSNSYSNAWGKDIRVVLQGGTQATNIIFFDNLSLNQAAVPEPGSVALMGTVGLVVVLAARKRRAKRV